MRWRLISGTICLSYIVVLAEVIHARIGTAWSYAIFIPFFVLMVWASHRADEERTARRQGRAAEKR